MSQSGPEIILKIPVSGPRQGSLSGPYCHLPSEPPSKQGFFVCPGCFVCQNFKLPLKKSKEGTGTEKNIVGFERSSSKSAWSWGSEMTKRRITVGFVFRTLLAFGFGAVKTGLEKFAKNFGSNLFRFRFFFTCHLFSWCP